MNRAASPVSHRPASECNAAADLWFFVHGLFRAPDLRQWSWLTSVETFRTLRNIAETLRLPPPRLEDWPPDRNAYEAEFIAAFDVGAPAPLIPLLESHYNRRDPVPRILHENILFYQAFGLRLRDASSESADHLRYQLEFVGYLHHLEGRDDARESAERTLQIRTARSDFVRRHLMSWLPAAAAKAAGAPFPWAKSLLDVTLELARSELRS